MSRGTRRAILRLRRHSRESGNPVFVRLGPRFRGDDEKVVTILRPFTFAGLRKFLFGRGLLLRRSLLRLLGRLALLLLAETLLQRRHQVDDVRASRRSFAGVRILDDLLTLLLLFLLDEAMERVDVAVVELVGIELAGFPLDQHRGHVEQVGIGLVVADIAEEAGRLVHLVGITQRLEHQTAVEGLERDDILLSPHRELPDADLVRGLERVAQHDIGFLGEIVGGDHVIGLVEIHRVDAVIVDELDQVERLAALELDALDLLGVEEDVVAFRDLIALHDLVLVDGTDARDDLFVFDPLARRLVDLMELDLGAASRGGIEFDRDRHQRQPDLPSPDRTRSHQTLSLPSRRIQFIAAPSRSRVAALRDRTSSVTSSPRAAASTIADPQMTPFAPVERAARTCSGLEIPKPNTGAGAPAAWRRRISCESNCPPAWVPVIPARLTQ